MDHVTAAALGGGVAATLTFLGSIASLLARGLGERRRYLMLDVGLGFSSGVMVTASFTSLIVPGVEYGGLPPVVLGLLAGAAAVAVLEETVPHQHVIKGFEGPSWAARKIRAAWLVALAILIHNLPEGMAIGAASAASPSQGIAMGLAIGLQDVPEGLAVSLPLLLAGYSIPVALLVGLLSGLSETLLAVVTAALVTPTVLPVALGFGAGAMLYVVSHEALPESHRSGHEGPATLGFFAGLLIMLVLDTLTA